MTTPTERFRRQHAELADHAREVMGHLADPAALAREPQGVRRTLAVLAGKLKVHAAMEDEALYPRLLSHEVPHVRETAHRFRTEFGDVYGTFLTYVDRWTPEAISAAPAEFVRETRAAMTALGERVRHENDHLYTMVDSLD